MIDRPDPTDSNVEFRDREAGPRADYAPQGTDAGTGWWPTLKRTVKEFQEDNLSDWAAALTYYGLLSLFPALIAMVSLIGIFGDPRSTTESLTEIITEIGPASAAETFEGPIKSITESSGTAGAGVDPRPRRLALVGVRLHRRLHARLEHHLRDPGGPPVLEATAAAAARHPGDDRPADPARRLAGPHRAGGRSGGRAARDRLRPRSTSGTSPSGR